MNRRDIAVAASVALAMLVLGIAGGAWWASRATGPDDAPAAAAGTEREVLYWYDPMVPDQHFDKPGRSPFMDMDLVPKYADEASVAGVRIDPGVRQNLGIRTGRVEVGTLAAEVTVPGTLAWDLRDEDVVATPVRAVVSRLAVRAPYERVAAGAPLASLLAPEWAAAIAESRVLSHAESGPARALRDASRERLRMLGLSGATALADGTVVLRAPRAGVASEILVREGEALMPGQALFRINGTRTLWLEAAIPQAATAAIVPGTPVSATVDAVPGTTFEGRVETLLPEVDATSRTRRARIVLRNEGELLAPGMFAEVTLQPDGGQAVPLVPNEAVIATGESERVIVMGDDGAFRPVPVRTGRSAGGRTEVLDGLEGGERVVVSGQFLVDSEASLSGALDRLEAKAPAEGSDE